MRADFRMGGTTMAGAGEAEKLKRELAMVRQRLEDEVAYHRGQAEAARRAAEAEHLRAQAAEVARRRRLEDQVADLEARLHESRDHGARLQRRYDELSQQFLQQEASARSTVEEEVARYRAAAQSAWRSAEEEVAEMELEVSRHREALERERARVRQLEDTLRTLQGVEGEGAEDRLDDLQGEVVALKKALHLSERARIQAQRRAVRLAEQLVELETAVQDGTAGAQGSGASASARQPGPFPASLVGTSANPQEVDLSEANEILRRAAGVGSGVGASDAQQPDLGVSLGDDLADEFLLVTSDESLDRLKLARLQMEVETGDQEDRVHEQAREQRRRRNVFLDQAEEAEARSSRPAKREQPATRSRQPVGARSGAAERPITAAPDGRSPGFSTGGGSRLPMIIAVLVLLGVAGGAAYWVLGGS